MTPEGEQQDWQNLVERYLSKTITKIELDRLLDMSENSGDLNQLDVVLMKHWESIEAGNNKTSRDWAAKDGSVIK